MNVRWLIERNGLYHWPSGWVAQAAVAQSYQTELEARASLAALSLTNPAGFAGAGVVSRTLVLDPSSGHWVEPAEPDRVLAALPTAGFAALPVEPEEEPAPDETLHPADAPQGAGDPAQVAKASKKLRVSAERERLALARFAADPAGTAWLHRLLTMSHLMSTSFSNDPHHTAFREGERNIGLFVLRELEAASDAATVARVLIRRGENA